MVPRRYRPGQARDDQEKRNAKAYPAMDARGDLPQTTSPLKDIPFKTPSWLTVQPCVANPVPSSLDLDSRQPMPSNFYWPSFLPAREW